MSSFVIYTKEEIASLRKSGAILRECLQYVHGLTRPGITTGELDQAAEAFIRERGGEPAFKGYHDYPATLCTSVNDQCVHAIPGDYTLEEGDIISLDGGVRFDGMITDACITVPVGAASGDAMRLLSVTDDALAAGIRQVRAGNRVGQISAAIQQVIETAGFSPVRALTGHGVGKAVHLYPDVPNAGKPGDGPVLPVHTVIAIEPIVAAGGGDAMEGEDGWTILTKDGSLCAHSEHTVLVTADGCEILA